MDDRFHTFVSRLNKYFDIPDGEFWNEGPRIEVLFEIVERDDNYEFDDVEL